MLTMSDAKGRWKILAASLVKSAKSNNVRRRDADLRALTRFPSFGFLTSTVSEEEADTNSERIWHRVQVDGEEERDSLDLRVCLLKPEITTGAKQLMGFNNTGNVCVWPAEECLAVLCSEVLPPGYFGGKRVVELGGGMTALAGLLLAKRLGPAAVTLTDGNEKSVENLRLILKENSFPGVDVHAEVLRWNEVPAEAVGAFDVAICADCLFFDDYREDLSRCLHDLLRPGGVALVVAPKRGHTLGDFRRLSEDRFDVRNLTSERMSRALETISQDERYDENVHLPVMMEMRRKGGSHQEGMHLSSKI